MMRPLTTILLLLIFTSGFCLEIEKDTTRKDTVRMQSPQNVRGITKTNPFAVLWGPIPLTSEFKILQEFTTHPYQSVQVGVSILRKSPLLALFEPQINYGTNDHYVVRGWRFQIAKRYYMKSKWYSPYGIYFSPSFSVASAVISTELNLRAGYYIKGTNYNASLLLGAQPIFFKSIAVDIFGGLGYQNKVWTEHYTKKNIVNPINPEDLGMLDIPVKLVAGFSIGFVN